MAEPLETDRLFLRSFRPEDAEDCFAFLSDVRTCHWDGGYEPFATMDEEYARLMEKFAGQEERRMVTLKTSGRVIGTVNLFPDNRRVVKAVEIGYVVSPAYRRCGYAYEAVKRVIEYVFQDTQTHLISAGVISRNLPSLAMLRKLGFSKEGTVRKGFWLPGEGAVDMESFFLEKSAVPPQAGKDSILGG